MTNTWMRTGALSGALALCALAAANGAAQVTIPRGGSVIQAGNAVVSSPSGADLGFDRLTCARVTIHGGGAGWIAYGAEPEIGGVRPDGPAAGRLRDGDVLVAVAGALITTRDGALRLARVRPGRPVSLTVRRQGKNVDVQIVPAGAAPPTLPALPALPAPPPTPPALPDIPAAPHIAAGGSGSLGAALSCDCSLQLDPDGAERWTFRAPPRVEAIGPGGAAEHAGLRAGDLIERIDGVATTSPEGGRRFGAIKPGQRVRLGILRGESPLEVVLVAGKR